MKCRDCVLCEFQEEIEYYNCKLRCDDSHLTMDTNAWLNRDCVRDDERRAKLLEQLGDASLTARQLNIALSNAIEEANAAERVCLHDKSLEAEMHRKQCCEKRDQLMKRAQQ